MYKAAWSNKKSTNHFCTQIANNTDVQPNIFQNPVLIFLNEQFKAHENIVFTVTKKRINRVFFCEFIRKKKLTTQKSFFFVGLPQQILYTLNSVIKI